MYQIKCDGFILDDPRDSDLTVSSPRVTLQVNTVGSCSFTIRKNHPYYDKLKKMKSVFEVRDDIGVIFRGRMLDDSVDFYGNKAVKLEGAMSYFNDSMIRPFMFPESFLEDPEYITASTSGNVIEFFLKWVIDQHNSQVEEFQRLKLGNVTVSDPNNYISRSSEEYASTWQTLNGKLFGSSIGGYLCIRYEPDGNYVDYLSKFTLTNPQKIVFGENLLDLKTKSNAVGAYSVMIPIGASVEIESTDENGEISITNERINIKGLPDGNITDDIVKEGDLIYSISAVQAYGWICAPLNKTTWDDVTEPERLRQKCVAALSTDLSLLTNSIEISALDLHFTDEEIQTFRIYRNVEVESSPHGHSGTYQLPKLTLDLHNPQNTKITVGLTQKSLTDVNSQKESSTIQRIGNAEKDIAANRGEISYVKNRVLTQSTQIINDCEKIILSALENYVESSDYDQFKQTLESELRVMAGRISLNFESTTEQITNVNGDLQAMIEKLQKHFDFTVDGLTIKAGENTMQLLLDNDLIRFTKNGQEFGWWDGVDFHTGNIMVDLNERAQFGNFAFIPRSNGSLDFLKVGG